jgi:DNA-binding FadR family transcriptional regulator
MRAAENDARLFDLEVLFWNAILEGSQNLTYRLAFNSMMKGVHAMGGLAQRWSAQECRAAEYRVPIASAIARDDETGAERVARKAMRKAVERFEAGLSGVRPNTRAIAK